MNLQAGRVALPANFGGRMKTRFTALAMLTTAVTNLSAQGSHWGLTPEIGFSRYHGSAREDSTDTTINPSAATSIGLRVDRTGNRIGWAVAILYEKTGVVETDAHLAVTIHDIITLYALRPEFSARLAQLGPTSLNAHAGLSIERWEMPGKAPKYLPSGLGGVSIQAPLGDLFSLEVRWEATLSTSVFSAEDLPGGFHSQHTLHSRLGLGIRLGL